ncbi:unnamed protein product, partial [Symbiodinium necroappetens]
EMTHHALIASIRIIRHFHLPRPAVQQNANYAVKDLDNAYRRNDPRIQALQQQIQRRLLDAATPTAETLNHMLIQEVTNIFPTQSRGKQGRGRSTAVLRVFFLAWREQLTLPDGEGGSVTSLPTQVYHMWQRRRDLLKSRLYDASGIIRTWKWIVLYLKAGRQSKQFHAQNQRALTLGNLQLAEKAAQHHNTKRLFGIVKRMIPWKPKPRIMLRHPDGTPMSLLQEHKALVQHCTQLFAPDAEPPRRPGTRLTLPLTEAEWRVQLQRTPIGKAVPADHSVE